MDGKELTDSAELVARLAHHGHLDKSGAPYVDHLRRVAKAVAKHGPGPVAVAWLHDLVEDRPQHAGLLLPFPIPVFRSVLLLTKSKPEPPELYFARIKADPWALAVKFADIADNLSEERMGKLPLDTQERLQAKYARALGMLRHG